MIVRPASNFDYAYVCRHMREKSWREASAIRGEISRGRMAREYNDLAEIAYFRIACCADAGPIGEGRTPASGMAIALFSAYRTGADFAAVHFIATERWPAIGALAYRYLRKNVFALLFPTHGIRRAQTDVMDTGLADRAWLHRIGFVDDGPPAALGRNGEMFQRVTWRAVDAPAVGLALPSLHEGHATHV
jgi:hypothetical protein